MISYDANILYAFAGRLYARASQAIVTATVLGCLIGAVLGGVVGRVLIGSIGIAAILGAAILGVAGYSIGTERAFLLRLQAQIALCQVKIEENTRKAE